MDREYIMTGDNQLLYKIERLKKEIDDKIANHDWLEEKLTETQRELADAKEWGENVIKDQRNEINKLNEIINTLNEMLNELK